MQKKNRIQEEEGVSNGHGTRTAAAVNRLRELIVTGALKPGQRISERSLLEEHADLSRTPLREALKILNAEGLIQLSPNRGAFVTRLSMKEIDAAMEVLIGLEGIAASASCLRISDEALKEIEGLHRAMLRAFRERDL